MPRRLLWNCFWGCGKMVVRMHSAVMFVFRFAAALIGLMTMGTSSLHGAAAAAAD